MLFRFFLFNPYSIIVLNVLMTLCLVMGNWFSAELTQMQFTNFELKTLGLNFLIHYKTSLLLNLGVVFLISICVEWILVRSNVNKDFSFITSFFCILFLLAIPKFQFLSAQILSLLMVCLSVIQIVSIYKVDDARREAFGAGFLLGISALLYLPMLFFVGFIVYGFITLKKVSFREIAISVIGLILPFLYYFSYLYLFKNQVDGFQLNLERVSFQLPQYISEYIAIAFIIILGVYALFNVYFSNGLTLGTQQKKILNQFFAFGMFVVLTIIFSGSKPYLHLGALVLPFSVFSGVYFNSKNKAKRKILLVLLLIVSVLYMQLDYHFLSAIEIKFIR